MSLPQSSHPSSSFQHPPTQLSNPLSPNSTTQSSHTSSSNQRSLEHSSSSSTHSPSMPSSHSQDSNHTPITSTNSQDYDASSNTQPTSTSKFVPLPFLHIILIPPQEDNVVLCSQDGSSLS